MLRALAHLFRRPRSFAALLRAAPRRPLARVPYTRLRFEALEDRIVPSGYTLQQAVAAYNSALATVNQVSTATAVINQKLGLNLPLLNQTLDKALHLGQDFLAPLQATLNASAPDWTTLAGQLPGTFTVLKPFVVDGSGNGVTDSQGNLFELSWTNTWTLPNVPLLVAGNTGFSYIDDGGGLFGSINGSGQVSVTLALGVDVNAQGSLGFFIASSANAVQATLTGASNPDGVSGSLSIGDLATVNATATGQASITGTLGLQATAADGKVRASDLTGNVASVVTGGVNGSVELDAKFDAQLSSLPDVKWSGTFSDGIQNGTVQPPSVSLHEPSAADLLGSLGQSLFSLGGDVPILGPLSSSLNDPLPFINESVAQLTGLSGKLPSLPSLPGNFGSLNGSYDVAGGTLTVNVTPTTIDQFLHGQPVDLVTWEAKNDLSLIDENFTIPIFSLGVPDIISAEIDATFGIHASLHYDVGFGLDGHGFWVRGGTPSSPNLGLTFGVTAGVQGQVEVFGFPLAEAGGDIGFAITPYVTLTAPPGTDPTKVYMSDLALFGSNPLSDILDDLSVGVQGAFTGEVYASIDLFLFSISWHWGVSIPVFNFERSPTWPALPGKGAGGALSLFDTNVHQNGGVLSFTGTAGSDNVHLSEGSDGSLTITWAGVGSRTYTGVTEFDFNGGGGGDRLTTDPAVTVPIKAQASGNDYLQGGAGRNTLLGGSGNDTLVAGPGDSSVVGGSGTELLIGGDGHDTITAGSGTDSIFGGAGNSTFIGGGGHDSIYAGEGNDVIQGGAGTYFIDGGTGSDTITGGSGANDSIYGGTGGANRITSSSGGYNLIYGGGPGDTIDGGLGGNDAIHASAGGYTGATTNSVIYGGAKGHNVLFGGGAGDTLYGVNVVNTVDGSGNPLTEVSGNNTIYGGAGNETIYGGDGQNLTFNPLVNGLSNAGGDGRAAGGNLIVGGSGNEAIYGDSTDPNTLQAGAGNDTLFAGTGNATTGDFLQAGPGTDALYGGPGNDSLQLLFTPAGQPQPPDTIVGGAGANTLVIRPPATIAPANPSPPTSLSAAITDTNTTDTISVASAANIAAGAIIQIDNERMQVTAVAGTSVTVMRGALGTAAATHAAAAPVLIIPQPAQATAGNYRMYFTQVAGTANQYVATLANLATANVTAGSSTVTVLDGTAQLTVGQPVSGPGIPAGTTITAVTASSITLSNAATATASDVPLIFGTTAQLNVTLPSDITNVALEGGAGDNWIQVDPSVARDLYLYGGTGHDTLMAGAGSDSLATGSGNDTLTAGPGSDTLVAGPGSSVLYGGSGDDFLYGGDLPSQDVPPQLSSAGKLSQQTGNTTSGSATITGLSSTANLVVGQIVTGPGVITGTTIASIPSASTITLSSAATATATGVALLFGSNQPEGHDTLIAGTGNSELFAGSGGDVLIGGSVARSVGPGGTPGLAILQDGQYQLAEGAGRDLLVGGTNPDASDLLIAGPGGPGSFLQAGAGNDVLVADNYGSNMLVAGSGNDLLLGGNLDNVMIGGTGNVTMVGGLGSDKLLGGSGNNVLYASYTASAWTQAEAVAAAAGVHLVPPQLLQGDDLSKSIQALLVKQAAGPLSAADAASLHDDLFNEFLVLYAEDSALVAQITKLEKLFGTLTAAQKQQLETLYSQDILILQERIQVDYYLESYTIAPGSPSANVTGGFGTKMLIGVSGTDTFYGDPVLPTWMGGNGTFYNYHPGDTIQGGAGTDNTLMFTGDGSITLAPDATNPNAVDVTIPGQDGGQPTLVGDGVGNVAQIQVIGVQTGNADGDSVTLSFPNNQALPAGLTGVSVQVGSGIGDVINAVNFQNAATLRAGAGSDTIQIGANLATAPVLQGSATGSTELDVYDTAGKAVTVAGRVLTIGGNPVNRQTVGLNFQKLVVVGGPGQNVFTTDGSVPNVVLKGGDGASNTFNVTGPGTYTIIGGGPAIAAAPQPTTGVAAPAPSGLSQSSTTLSQGRTFISAASVGGKALFAGGEGYGNGLNGATALVDIYDASAGQWLAPGTLSEIRFGMAAAAVGTKALFAGGIDPSLPAVNDATNTVDIYDASTGQWSTSTLHQKGSEIVVATVGTTALFADGRQLGSGFTNVGNAVDIYIASTGQWSTTTLPHPRLGMVTATVGSLAMFAGGLDSNGNSSPVVDIYDTATGQWSSANMSVGRGNFAATTVGTKVLFAGGDTGNLTSSFSQTNEVDIFDASTGQWSTANLSQARDGLVAAAVGTKAIFAGGQTGPLYTAASSAVVDIYDAITGQWSTAALSQPGAGGTATVVGTTVVFAGFSAFSRSATTDANVYDGSTGQWTAVPLTESGENMAAVAVGAQVILAGGGNPLSNPTNAVTIFTFPASAAVGMPPNATGGTASIPYTLTGETSNAVSIQVQYRINGGYWQPATPASGGDGTTNLAASPNGSAHTFVWNTAHDLGRTNNPNVQVRITPSDATGIGETQTSAGFSVNNSGVSNVLNIAFTGPANDIVHLAQNGSTVAFSGTANGTATNVTAVSVTGGTGNDLLDASGMVMPVTLKGGGGQDTLLGGAGSDALYVSGPGSTYNGGGGAANTLVYPANPGEVVAVGGSAIVVNDTDKSLASGNNVATANNLEDVLVAGSPAGVNGGTQQFWPVDDLPLNVAGLSMAVTPGTPASVLTVNVSDAFQPGGIFRVAYTVAANWGDGTTTTVLGGAVTPLSHVYATPGSRLVTVTVQDLDGGAAFADGVFATSGLAISGGSLVIEGPGGNPAPVTLDSAALDPGNSPVQSYLVRNTDQTVFSLHANGDLFALSPTGTLQQADAGVQSIALGPDGTLYAVHAGGGLYAAASGTTQTHFVIGGVQAIVTDSGGNVYRLFTSGVLDVTAPGATTATVLRSDVKSLALSADLSAASALTADGHHYLFSGTVATLLAGPHFAVTMPATVTAGQSVPVTLAVLDYQNNPVLGYTGTVQFADSDAAAVAASGPPPQHTFAAGDNGVYQFNLTFLTSGTQTLTATDGSGLSATASVLVNPAAAAVLSVDPPPVLVGTAAPVTVTAYDAYGNVVTGYTGTVRLSAANPGATTAASYTFTSTALQGNTTAGSVTVTGLASTAGLSAGEAVTGPGIPAGVTISAVASGTSVVLSGAATATASGVPLTFGDQGTHTFGPTFTKAGAQKLVATDTGSTGSTGAGDIVVNAAALDLSQSTVSVNPGVVGAGLSTVVTLTERDKYGNPETTGGDTVVFSLAAGSTGGFNVSATRDNGDGTYSATFTAVGGLLGNNNISASINGHPVTSNPASLVVVAGPPSPSKSSVTFSPTSVQAGGTTTVTVTAIDAFGNVEPAGVSVAFGVSTGSAGGTFGPASYSGNGVYMATFTGTTAGSNTMTATIEGVTLTSAQSVTVTPGSVSLAQTSMSVSPNGVTPNGTATVTLTTRDAYGNPIGTGGLQVGFGVAAGSIGGSVGSVADRGDGTYTATFTAGTLPGTSTVTATIGGKAVTSPGAVVTITAGPADPAHSSVTVASTSIVTGGTTTVTLTTRDAYGNPETTGGLQVAFGLAAGSAGGSFGPLTDNHDGTYTAVFTAAASGNDTLTAAIGGQAVTTAMPTLRALPAGFSYDASSKTLTISVGGQGWFFYSQASTQDASGVHTTYTFSVNGASASYADAALAGVSVVGTGGANAVLTTDDTYAGTDGRTHETAEQILMGNGGGTVEKADAAFVSLAGFQRVFAIAGQADRASVIGTAGVFNYFGGYGSYALMSTGSSFYYASGAGSVVGYSEDYYDWAVNYDGSGPSYYTAAGTTLSEMSGTDHGQAFLNEAYGFHFNEGIATHAGDVAYLSDSAGNDVLAGYGQYTSLTCAANGEQDYLTTYNGNFFAQVYAYAFNGGYDTASVDASATSLYTVYTFDGHYGYHRVG